MFDITSALDDLVASLPPVQFAGVVRAETGRWTRSARRTDSCGMNTERAR